MKIKRLICLLMALALIMALPVNGLAAKKPSIKLGGKLGLMFAGESIQLKPKLKYVSKGDVNFESSDTEAVSVTAGGVVTSLTEGRSVITVSGGGTRAKCGVVVLPRRVSLAVGEHVSLPNGTLEKYSVKNKKIAKVSKKGVVTALKAGKTTITVKYGKQKKSIQVVVTAASSTGDTGSEAVQKPADSKAAKLDAAKSATQIVLVEHTGGSKATLSVHEKRNGVWTQLMETSAYVGKNGIGKTKEGDKKTPTGTYNLNTPFGIKDDPGAKLPYTKVTKYHYWCGASKSGYYNQLCDSRENGRSYTSSDEHLIDYKGVYNYCMFIDYNAAGVAGKGSCIFLHCKGKNAYTAGCVAIDEASMKQIIQWAGPGTKIVIQKAK